MKRALLTQMSNEWRENCWLVLGLTIVSIVIWLFCSAMFTTLRYYNLPLGFDDRDVCVISLGEIDEESPEYVDFGEETVEKNMEDLRLLLKQIRNNPNVEAAGFSYYGTPYTQSSYNGGLYIFGNEPDTIGFSACFRFISPEVADVLRLRSLTGKDGKWLRERLENGEVLVSPDPLYNETLLGKKNKYGAVGSWPADHLLGKNVHPYRDSLTNYHVADLVQLVRRYHFDDPYNGGAIIPLVEEEMREIGDMNDILVRVKPGRYRAFREEMESSPEMMAQRNVYLYNIRTLEDMKVSVEHSDMINLRLYVFLISFLLVILFLGMLGTFWFRIQQRVSEIAIRRVCGASRGVIFRRVIGEGMVLLAVASLLGGIVGWIIIKKTSLFESFTTIELIAFEAATIIIVAIGIMLSISWPAWRAMSIEPAVAVKDE